MFDKIKEIIPYDRKDYTLAEELYNNYVEMRKATLNFERTKYMIEKDDFIQSKEGKEGFIAGVYAMLSLIADM